MTYQAEVIWCGKHPDGRIIASALGYSIHSAWESVAKLVGWPHAMCIDQGWTVVKCALVELPE